MKPKLLLYCCKAKPYLYKTDDTMIEKMFGDYHTQLNKAVLNDNCLNGKIVAECDFDVEEITIGRSYGFTPNLCIISTKNLQPIELLSKSCYESYDDLFKYLKYDFDNDYGNHKGPYGYAIHIKNLHIFAEPKELSEYFSKPKKMDTLYGSSWVCESIDRAPQNMMYAYDGEGNKYIVISIQSQWMCEILNGNKTVEVRKKVLKEMLE